MDIPITNALFVGYIYILTSPYRRSNNRRKIGLSTLPHHRLNTYLTGCCDLDELYFEKLYQVRVCSIAELHAIETMMHTRFEAFRRRREWFELESPEPVHDFICSLPAFMQECALADIQDLQHSNDSVKQEEQLMNLRSTQQSEPAEQSDPTESIRATRATDEDETFAKQHSLRNDYFNHMLEPGQVPRRIQSELFDAFMEKTATATSNDAYDAYKGIVQWPTAVGKTIGTLSLLFISFMRCLSKGKIWRGLLIAPQNDILNTIIGPIKKLEKWGINIISGHDAQFTDAMIKCPTDKHVLIITTHASLTDRKKWDMLPEIYHCHYDEVHQCTGLQFFGMLKEWIPKFVYFTGTSATPKTCNSDQHSRLHDLFGSPLSILHQCEMDEAVREGWIAKPKISANIVEFGTRIQEFVGIISQSIAQKRADGKWMYGKVIVYLDTITDVQNAVCCALHDFKGTDTTVYMAVKNANEHEEATEATRAVESLADESEMLVAGAKSDKQFISDAADGSPRILFACQRYRQGSDIKGIEMTVVLFNATIATNVVVQIIGRALRKDANYDNKEGWCVLVKTRCPEGSGDSGDIEEDDVLDSILLEFANFVLVSSGSSMHTKQKIREFVMQILVPLRNDKNKNYSIEETVNRMQCMYLRKEFATCGNKCVREYCNENGVDSSFEYAELRKRETRIPLPSDVPCRQNETVFMFFHPNEPRVEKSDFTSLLKRHDLCTSQKYETWRNGACLRAMRGGADCRCLDSDQPSRAAYPSIQHITDGYFGANDTNFNSLLENKRTVRR